MPISLTAACARFYAAGSVRAADDEALGAAAMMLAARFGNSMHLGLPTRLARMSGGSPLAFEIAAIRVGGREHGPWRADLRPLHETGDDPIALADLPRRSMGVEWPSPGSDRASTTRLIRRGSNFLRALRGVAALMRDREIRSMDPGSVGAAIRPLTETVEEKADRLEAVLIGTMLARLLAQNVGAAAGASRIQVTGGSIGDEEVGSWNLVVSTAAAEFDDEKRGAAEPRLEGGLIRRADPPSARSRAAQRLLAMDRIVELTTTYERDDDGSWAVAEVGFRGEIARGKGAAPRR